MLKNIVLVTALSMGLCLASFAAERHLTPQQIKMGVCSKQAKKESLRGSDRLAFMSKCLKSSLPSGSSEQTAPPEAAIPPADSSSSGSMPPN
jgi:hypothetical protein